jgi:hypothetical protein
MFLMYVPGFRRGVVRVRSALAAALRARIAEWEGACSASSS